MKLGDVAKVISGYAFKSSQFSEMAGVPVIKIKNIKIGRADLTEVDYVSEDNLNINEKFHVNSGDILISLTGSHITQPNSVVGRVGLYQAGLPTALLNQRAGKIIPFSDEVDKSFLLYYLSSIESMREIAQMAHGAASQANVSPSQVESLEIPLPDINSQRQIGEILSAYDNLIENNNRRIAILEEMAQSLYREWFVNFRFPGFESCKFVDSPLGKIPEGWKVSEFKEIFDIKYGKNLPKTEIQEYGEYPVYGAGAVIGFYDNFICEGKCALITSRGNGSGTVWRTREKAFVTNNSFMIRSKKNVGDWSYAYVVMLLMHSNVKSAKTGSAQPQITIENLNYVKALIPTDELISIFSDVVTCLYDQVDFLYKQVKKLQEMRDLLLPKLINGNIRLEYGN